MATLQADVDLSNVVSLETVSVRIVGQLLMLMQASFIESQYAKVGYNIIWF